MGHPDRIGPLIEARIKAARESGEFDDLPGAGKRIPGHGEPYDENWWIKEFMRREGLGGEFTLPPSLGLAREVERLPEQVPALPSEQRVREVVAEVNARVTAYHLRPTHPFVPVRRVDADRMVEVWRAALARRRAQRAEPPEPPEPADRGATSTAGRRGWFRLGRGFFRPGSGRAGVDR